MTQRKFVNFAEICITVYVRAQLGEERMRFFADLYTSSGSSTVPPIVITTDNKLVDGRHRMAALKYLGETGCVCDIIECKDNFELTIAAMKANVGGSKDLTMADVRQSIMRLLCEGYSQKKITAQLPFPKEMCRKYVKEGFTMLKQQKTTLAVREVQTKHATLAEAAHRYHLQQRVIQNAVARAERKEVEGELSNVGAVKGHITSRYGNLSKSMGGYFRRLVERYSAGDFTEAQMRDIMAHVLHQARGHLGAMNDWNDRFDVMLKTNRPLIEYPMPPKKLPVSGPTLDQQSGGN